MASETLRLTELVSSRAGLECGSAVSPEAVGICSDLLLGWDLTRGLSLEHPSVPSETPPHLEEGVTCSPGIPSTMETKTV